MNQQQDAEEIFCLFSWWSSSYHNVKLFYEDENIEN